MELQLLQFESDNEDFCLTTNFGKGFHLSPTLRAFTLLSKSFCFTVVKIELVWSEYNKIIWN